MSYKRERQHRADHAEKDAVSATSLAPGAVTLAEATAGNRRNHSTSERDARISQGTTRPDPWSSVDASRFPRGETLDAFGDVIQGIAVQRKASRESEALTAPVAAQAIQRAAADAGAPLPGELRGRFESSLGTDLSNVRVHTGAASETAASAVGAKAYTTGQDIHFAAGAYDPSSKPGQQLIAHEVAHTVQQAGARTQGPQFKLDVSQPGDAYEREADRAADAMVDGSATAVSKGAVSGTISRSPSMLNQGIASQPIIFEAPPERTPRPFELGLPPVADDPIPAPFDMPVPIDRCVAPPRAHDWSATPPVAASPTEPLTGTPGYKPQYASENLDAYKTAFGASWSELQSSYNALLFLHQGYKAKEKEIAPILRLDPGTGVAAEASRLDATASFEGPRLKPAVSKIDPTKVDPALAKQLVAARDKVDVSELTIASQKEGIATANSRLHQVALDVENAMSDIDIAHLEGDIASLQLDKDEVRRDLEQAKANIKATVESAKAAFSIVNVITNLADPTKLASNVVGALNQTATAGGAVTEAAYVSDANKQLAAIDARVRTLQSSKFHLLIKKASNTLDKNLEEMRIKGREINKAMRDLQIAKKGQAAVYRELAEIMGKVGAASGMNGRDQRALSAAVEAVPKIEAIIDQLDAMDRHLAVPPYSEASGIGAAMSSNLGAFTHALGVLKGNEQYLAEQKAIWSGRKMSVKAAIDQALLVPGTEI